MDLQAARQEGNEQTDLPGAARLEAIEGAERQNENGDVADDVGKSGNPPQHRHVHRAVAAGNRLVPAECKRLARRQTERDARNQPADNKSEHDPGGDSDPAVGEDAQVQNQDAGLGDGGGHDVGELDHHEQLEEAFDPPRVR